MIDRRRRLALSLSFISMLVISAAAAAIEMKEPGPLLDSSLPAFEDEAEEDAASDTRDLVLHSKSHRPLMSRSKIILMCTASFGTQFLFLLLSVEIVPSQIERFVGDSAKGKTLGIVAAVGSVVTFIVSPLIGTFSDRSTSKYGRRRPYIAAATVIMIVGLSGMALFGGAAQNENKKENGIVTPCNETHKPQCPQNTSNLNNLSNSTTVDRHEIKYLIGYSVFFLIGTACYAIVSVAYNGLVADKVDKSQRGLTSGIMACLTLVGLLAGAGVGLVYDTLTDYGVFGVIYVVFAAAILVTLVSTKETPLLARTREKIAWKSVIAGYWKPLKEHNFRYVFFTRFLLQMGLSTVIAYLQYWFQDVVPIPHCKSPENAVAMAMLPLLVCAAISSVVCGYLSDRFHRRKPFVCAAGLAMCLCCASLAGLPSYYPAIVTASVFGLSYGCYVAVDWALVIDVLPNETDIAKDIAVWHQALIIPQVIATPIGGFLLDSVQDAPLPGHSQARGCSIGLGYIVTFSVSGLYLLLSSILVTKIRIVEGKQAKSASTDILS